MASLSIALGRATASSLLSKFTNPIRSVSVCRSFNTNTQVTNVDDNARSLDVDHRSARSVSRRRDTAPTFFSDVFNPFLLTRSLTQVLNLMDQLIEMDNPFLSRSAGGLVAPRGWDVKEDENALFLRMDMPGVNKDHVKVSVEQNTLIIRGEGEKENEDEESVRKYCNRLDLPPNLYKVDEIKAEMKNGVLKVVVPKVKEEERKVHEVKVE